METLIEGSGTARMIYNYLTNEHRLFRVNETIKYDKIVKLEGVKDCNCSGKVNTYYVVDGCKIPTSRAVKI